MPSLAKLTMHSLLVLGVLLPDLALAMPLGPSVGKTGRSDVIQAGGVVCDFDGNCRDYDTRYRRRIYVDPPLYDDDPYYQPPPVYMRPRVQRRIIIEPPPPAPVYQPRPYLSRRHVQWCLDRYRSYNPRTNLYLLRRNVYRHCLSPFS